MTKVCGHGIRQEAGAGSGRDPVLTAIATRAWNRALDILRIGAPEVFQALVEAGDAGEGATST